MHQLPFACVQLCVEYQYFSWSQPCTGGPQLEVALNLTLDISTIYSISYLAYSWTEPIFRVPIWQGYNLLFMLVLCFVEARTSFNWRQHGRRWFHLDSLPKQHAYSRVFYGYEAKRTKKLPQQRDSLEPDTRKSSKIPFFYHHRSQPYGITGKKQQFLTQLAINKHLKLSGICLFFF